MLSSILKTGKKEDLMNNQLNFNNQAIQGLLALAGGFLLLLYTLGVIETGINFIFILASIGLIMYGAISLGLDNVIKRWLGR